MAHENHIFTNSTASLRMPQEPRGTYHGSTMNSVINDDKSSVCGNIKFIVPWIKLKVWSMCRKKMLYKRLPICNWLPMYSGEDAVGDLIAGITIGLTVIPQALAYALLAGLEPVFGLYGSFLGCFAYMFLGSCKDVAMGPTAIASLLTHHATGGVWQRAVLLTFLTGIVELVMCFTGLGFLVNFVSDPVNSGFTSAVALIILTTQVKDILGIKVKGRTFVDVWISIFQNINDIRMNDTIVGVSCIIVLLLLRLLAITKIGPKEDNLKTTWHKVINKSIWVIGISRNAILVFVTTIISYQLHQAGPIDLRVVGTIPAGMPTFEIPQFSIPEIVNKTTDEIIQHGESFTEMISHTGYSLIVIPLIALLENMSICKAFANGKPVDATQELLAIGTSNIMNSCVKGFPGTGSFSRGAVNNASGVRTPFGGLYTGLLVISSLFITPLFYYIPKATLAAIIISAVLFMVEVRVIRPMWRSKKTDLIPGLASFIACLVLPLEIGILAGITINLLFILYQAARPKISIEFHQTRAGSKYLMLTPDRCLIFPSMDYVKNVVNKLGIKSQMPVVIDCSHIYGADFTAAQVIQSLVTDFLTRNQRLIFYKLKTEVGQVLDGLDIDLNVQYDFSALENYIDGQREN